MYLFPPGLLVLAFSGANFAASLLFLKSGSGSLAASDTEVGGNGAGNGGPDLLDPSEP